LEPPKIAIITSIVEAKDAPDVNGSIEMVFLVWGIADLIEAESQNCHIGEFMIFKYVCGNVRHAIKPLVLSWTSPLDFRETRSSRLAACQEIQLMSWVRSNK